MSEEIISAPVRAEILRRLRVAEVERNVRILYACEAGSRAWGFAAPDSDYDVRFVYVREADWYLSFDVENRRDIIEYPITDSIDCGGWDLRKALHLFTRTNGSLLEWLNSPVVYIQRGGFAEVLRELAPACVNTIALCYHYSHMAKGNAREYLFHDQVRLKKYFYVLRPLLAIRYIESGKGIPPIEFEALVESVCPPQLRAPIADLLALKRRAEELGMGDPIPAINRFVESELERHGAAFSGHGRPDVFIKDEIYERLNALFRESVRADAA